MKEPTVKSDAPLSSPEAQVLRIRRYMYWLRPHGVLHAGLSERQPLIVAHDTAYFDKPMQDLVRLMHRDRIIEYVNKWHDIVTAMIWRAHRQHGLSFAEIAASCSRAPDLLCSEQWVREEVLLHDRYLRHKVAATINTRDTRNELTALAWAIANN